MRKEVKNMLKDVTEKRNEGRVQERLKYDNDIFLKLLAQRMKDAAFIRNTIIERVTESILRKAPY